MRALTQIGPLTEGWVLAMVGGAFGGVLVGAAIGGPLVGPSLLALAGAGLVLVIALALRRPILVVLAVMLLAGTRSGTETAAYQQVEVGTYDGPATLITDPESSAYGWSAEVGLDDGRRVRVNAHGSVADPLIRANAGQVLHLEGTLKPTNGSSWLRSRHIVGNLSASDIWPLADARWYYQPSQALRSLVAASASQLPYDLQPLYLGLVIGDDRQQSEAQTARFRAAGLTHLLAVSGQNVAFVLAVVGPMINRFGVRSRLFATLAILVVFAIATRLEPSVMRATFTAGIAAWSVALGRRSTGVRALGLATSLLVIVDPFLVWSVGFQLSVGASLAIVLLAPAVIGQLPGSGALTQSAGITLAAQVGVAPIMFAVFGPVSLVTLPANVLAGWAAGLVMMWGMSAGLVSGLLVGVVAGPAAGPGADLSIVGVLVQGVAQMLQWPAVALVWWIDTVGTYSARAPLPMVGPLGAGVLLASLLIDRGAGGRIIVRIGLVVLWVALLAPAVPAPPDARSEFVGGATWYPAAEGVPSVLVLSAGADDRVVEALIQERITTLDILVVLSPTGSAGRLANQVVETVGPGLVLAHSQHRVLAGRRVLADLTLPTVDGPLLVAIEGDRLTAVLAGATTEP